MVFAGAVSVAVCVGGVICRVSLVLLFVVGVLLTLLVRVLLCVVCCGCVLLCVECCCMLSVVC